MRDLYMCPHTATCVSSYYHTCVHSWQKSDAGVLCSRVLPTIYVSAYCYICVLILLYVCPHTIMCALILTLLFLLPLRTFHCGPLYKARKPEASMNVHSTRLVSLRNFNYYIFKKNFNYYTIICVLILLYTCPHNTIYMSAYCYMCPHTNVCVSSYNYTCVLILYLGTATTR